MAGKNWEDLQERAAMPEAFMRKYKYWFVAWHFENLYEKEKTCCGGWVIDLSNSLHKVTCGILLIDIVCFCQTIRLEEDEFLAFIF